LAFVPSATPISDSDEAEQLSNSGQPEYQQGSVITSYETQKHDESEGY
jgi:hypothetical protein